MIKPHSQTLTILIVEDEPAWQRDLSRLLQSVEATIVSAFDYPDALNQIERLGVSLLLAIVDIRLPMSGASDENDYGLHVLDTLREKGVYAIVMSGHTYDHAKLLARRPEVCEVIDKLRFADEQFEQIFIDKVSAALEQAEAARRAEGKMPEQQQRLRNLSH